MNIIDEIKQLNKKDYEDFISRRIYSLRKEEKHNTKNIGINKLGIMKISGYESAASDFLDSQKISIENGLGDVVLCTIGNINEVYIDIVNEINKNDCNESDIFKYIFKVVNNYFGDFSNIAERMKYYPNEDLVELGEKQGEISQLKGKNAGMCVERAVLSHNIMKFLGIDSTLKFSGIINDDKLEAHTYNLVSMNDSYYIYDSTIPKLDVDNSINPIITEIPKEAYELQKDGNMNNGYSIETNYYSPISDRNRHIIYDCNRGNKKEKTVK